MTVLKQARVSFIGDSKFGGKSIAVKHADYDGFLQVKDESGVDVSGVEKDSIIDVIYTEKGKEKHYVTKLRVTGKAEPKKGGGKWGGKGGGGFGGKREFTEAEKAEFAIKDALPVAADLTKYAIEKGILKLGAQGKQEEQMTQLFDTLALHIYQLIRDVGKKAEAESKVKSDAKSEPDTKAPAETEDFDAPAAAGEAEGDAEGFEDDFDSN
jgi:hypothetical protein